MFILGWCESCKIEINGLRPLERGRSSRSVSNWALVRFVGGVKANKSLDFVIVDM